MSLVRFYNSGIPCAPAANISETGTEYSLSIALPGIDKKHIRIRHEKGYLTIHVERNGESNESDNYTRREFDYQGASRVFRTGEKIDSEKITAGYEKGILTVHLPKREAFINKPAQLIAVE